MTSVRVLPNSISSVRDGISRQLRNAALDRMVRRTPGNEAVALRDVVMPQVDRLLARLHLVPPAVQRRRRRQFTEDLQLLNDVLAGTAMGHRYWVWGGMLLGWAREGRLIPSDTGDADFFYRAADDHHLDDAMPALLAAGFRPWFSFWNNDGERTERVLIRRGALFEFFRLDDVDGSAERYHLYGTGPGGPCQMVAHLAQQDLESFDFLGRTWLKPVDHEKLFELNYGDWRTPDPGWSYLDDGAIVDRRTWRPTSTRSGS